MDLKGMMISLAEKQADAMKDKMVAILEDIKVGGVNSGKFIIICFSGKFRTSLGSLIKIGFLS